MGFFKNMLASVLGTIIAIMMLSVLGIVIISALTAKEEIVIPSNSVLHIKLAGEIKEFYQDDPIESLLNSASLPIGIVQLKQILKHAKTDGKVAGILLEVDPLNTSYGSLEEIRVALKDFKESGKKVVAYNENLTEGGYYLSSVADQVYLNPLGEIEFNGLVSQFASFKKLLDKLKIKPQVFRVGDYKSAVEPFILEKMSAENRTQLSQLIESIYTQLLEEIASSRKLNSDSLRLYSNQLNVQNAKDALAYGLIDGLLYQDEVIKKLGEEMGIEQGKVKFVGMSRYQKTISTYKKSANEIAVIVMQGTIMPGESDQGNGMLGADTFVKEIRKAREDKGIKAVVLRVNSPGGEYVSSDRMWREIELTSQVKPIIASMGDYAASGGYYISAPCDTIIAQPGTITGSIGIFGLMFDMSQFFEDWVGVTFDEVRTGNYGNKYTVTRPLTEQEKTMIQTSLDSAYLNFVNKVVQGRTMDFNKVKSIAGGRVWTGSQAIENGLVDMLGGLEDAIDIAAQKAGIGEDYKVRYYPKQKTILEQLMNNKEESEIKIKTGEYYLLYEKWKQVKTFGGAQAQWPFDMSIN